MKPLYKYPNHTYEVSLTPTEKNPDLYWLRDSAGAFVAADKAGQLYKSSSGNLLCAWQLKCGPDGTTVTLRSNLTKRYLTVDSSSGWLRINATAPSNSSNLQVFRVVPGIKTKEMQVEELRSTREKKLVTEIPWPNMHPTIYLKSEYANKYLRVDTKGNVEPALWRPESNNRCQWATKGLPMYSEWTFRSKLNDAYLTAVEGGRVCLRENEKAQPDQIFRIIWHTNAHVSFRTFHKTCLVAEENSLREIVLAHKPIDVKNKQARFLVEPKAQVVTGFIPKPRLQPSMYLQLYKSNIFLSQRPTRGAAHGSTFTLAANQPIASA